MKKILSWKNLLVILLASMFLGVGLRTSKDINLLYWATFVDMFSFLVLLLLIIAAGREAIRKYRDRKSIGELFEKKIENNLDDSLFKKLSEFYKKELFQILILFKKHRRALILGLLAILIVAGVFYWYEWRPTQIKKECYDVARQQAEREYWSSDEGIRRAQEVYLLEERAKGMGLPELPKLPPNEKFYLKYGFEDNYRNCLKRQGL